MRCAAGLKFSTDSAHHAMDLQVHVKEGTRRYTCAAAYSGLNEAVDAGCRTKTDAATYRVASPVAWNAAYNPITSDLVGIDD